jgi:hypothetical protein
MKQTFRLLTFISLVIATGIVLYGCDRYTRYKVTTVFFTGVPPISGDDPLLVKKAIKPVPGSLGRMGGFLTEIPSFAHGPFSAGECGLCHETSSTVG